MRRTLWTGIFLVLLGGCATGPIVDAPVDFQPPPGYTAQEYNPMYIALSGPKAYSIVFENCLKVLHDSGFELLEHNRYDGHIETRPRIAPGLGQPFKAGSPDLSNRLLATFQTYRQRASIKIQPAENGGFFIYVIVYRELEDLPRPIRATAGAVIYQGNNNVDRQFDVVDPTQFESNWIPRGRDLPMEQIILQRLRSCM